MKDLKIDKDTVVHCETEELANQVLTIAHELGYKWIDGYSYMKENLWKIHKEKTCYELNKGCFSNLYSYGKMSNIKIISAQEFIDKHTYISDEMQENFEKMADSLTKHFEGQKFDEGKLLMFTVLVKQFPNAIKEIVKCSQVGNSKYKKTDKDWLNYQRVDLTDNPNRYLDASVRHLFESEGELKLNEDMKEYGDVFHLAQFIWNGMAHLEIKLKK